MSTSSETGENGDKTKADNNTVVHKQPSPTQINIHIYNIEGAQSVNVGSSNTVPMKSDKTCDGATAADLELTYTEPSDECTSNRSGPLAATDDFFETPPPDVPQQSTLLLSRDQTEDDNTLVKQGASFVQNEVMTTEDLVESSTISSSLATHLNINVRNQYPAPSGEDFEEMKVLNPIDFDREDVEVKIGESGE